MDSESSSLTFRNQISLPIFRHGYSLFKNVKVLTIVLSSGIAVILIQPSSTRLL